jgi:hypothetical protein
VPDFERRTTIGLDADTVFERLSEPAQLPLWLVGVTLDEAIAVDGDPGRQDEGEARPTAAPARFVADRTARRVEWSSPSGDYSGELQVEPLLAGMSAITARLRTTGPVDPGAAESALEAALKRLQRVLTD